METLTPDQIERLRSVAHYVHLQLNKKKRMTTEKYSMLINLTVLEDIIFKAETELLSK